MVTFFLGFITCYAMFVTSYLVLHIRQTERNASKSFHPTNGKWN